jgi:hypothetical protein
MSDDFEFIDGLTETTEEDMECFDFCMSHSIPFTAHWENLNDDMKVFQWDSEWEKYIKHRTEVIDQEGRESYLPWNLYRSLGLSWIDGYAKSQGTGDCASFGHFNACKASMLSNARRTGKIAREFALSVAYGIARGNGKMSFGSGCNLNPLSKWTATVGNFWTSDFGKYDVGRYISKYQKGSQQDKNALKTQTIPIYLPSPSFDYCYAVCSAGFGINIGSGVYPTGSSVNGDGLGQASSWKNGGHSVALIAAWTSKSGKRYVFLENSHGQKYVADSLSGGVRQWGCWMSEADIKKMGTERYGRWYVSLTEMGG